MMMMIDDDDDDDDDVVGRDNDNELAWGAGGLR